MDLLPLINNDIFSKAIISYISEKFRLSVKLPNEVGDLLNILSFKKDFEIKGDNHQL